MISVTYNIDESHKLVIDAAVKIISETMERGANSNGEGTWCNRDPLGYRARKALIHIASLHQMQDLNAREIEAPKLKHLYNAVTRLCMAQALNVPGKAVLVETLYE